MRGTKGGSRELFGSPESFPIVFIAAVIAYAIHQYAAAPTFFTTLRLHDTDDAMRLLSVRGLLAGQDWFDMVQHRALPPDGVSLHWSRFIDAGIAGLNLMFLQVAGPEMAERLAVAAWPALLFGVYLTVVGRTTRTLFGTSAASFAMIAVAAMQIITSSYFPFGRVDHHNVQLVCMVAICASLILQGDPLIRGAVAGAVAAFSLAIGLEAIIFIALAGLILTFSHVAGRAGAGYKLIGFGLGLGLLAPALFVAQTAPAAWIQPQCDALSLPFLALTGGAAIASIGMVFAGGVLRPGWQRLAAAAAFAGLLIYICFPLLEPCLEGPYSDLPDIVKSVVIGNIIEAVPAAKLLDFAPALALQVLLPLYLTAAATVLYLVNVQLSGEQPAGGSALMVIMAFLCLGAAASLFQVRGFLMGLAVLPIAFGVVFSRMTNGMWTRNLVLKIMTCLGFAIVVLVPHFLILGANAARSVMRDAPGSAPAATVYKSDEACNTRDILVKLDVLPASLIMAPMNLGTQILLYTKHSVTSVPYHRSADAMANGVIPFLGDGTQMAAKVQEYGVDYVFVCAEQDYGPDESMGSLLARGEVPQWLKPVDIGDGPIRLHAVLRDDNGNLVKADDAGQ